jgi:hypothetical protein
VVEAKGKSPVEGMGKRLLRKQGSLAVDVTVTIDHGGDQRVLERLVRFLKTRRS